MNDAPLLSVHEVALKLGVTKHFVFSLIKKGDLPVIKLGGMYRVDQLDLKSYLASCRVEFVA